MTTPTPTPNPTPTPTSEPSAGGAASSSVLPPNHHADHPGFAGVQGALMALVFASRGRTNARLVADLARVDATDRVIDIGCGPGTAVREAARRGATATGVDPAPVMLRVARALTRPGRRTTWRVGAAESIPASDGSATVAWSMACVHHWADIDAGLLEVRRVLAPGGRLLAIERQVRPDGTGVESHGWLPEQAEAFAARCTELGFVDVGVEQHVADRGPALLVRATRA